MTCCPTTPAKTQTKLTELQSTVEGVSSSQDTVAKQMKAAADDMSTMHKDLQGLKAELKAEIRNQQQSTEAVGAGACALACSCAQQLRVRGSWLLGGMRRAVIA